uniref:RNA-directed RNA polymerase n=2 Tax=Bursaphelenchus xylophilus TaxID=6326 RepID=A0A1I7SG97_BURXY
NHTFDHCKSEFQRILQTDRFDWLNNDDDFEEGLERRTFEATVFMYEVPVKVTILVAQSQWLDPNMDLLEKICEPI